MSEQPVNVGEFDYGASGLPVRTELSDTNRRTWQRLGKPGNWWTGAERIAIAAETRNARSCDLCVARKAALSPEAVQGGHAVVAELPDPSRDAVHKVVIDQSRLSREWVQRLAERGLSDGHYIELLGIVVAVVNIDTFHYALGLKLPDLPKPSAGDPTNYRPQGLVEDEAWVPMLARGKESSADADLFADLPHAPNVLRALSLVPDAVRCLRDLESAYYLAPVHAVDPTDNGGRAISRRQIEFLAARVSALNECFY